MFGAVLDTCVLWPSLQRDFLLSLAVENLYRPLWSTAILAELELHEERKLVQRGWPPDQARTRAATLAAMMTDAFDGALVHGWEALDGSSGLQIISAADFAANTCAVDPVRARTAVQQISVRHRSPSRTIDELLALLSSRYGMHEAVEPMRNP